MSVSDLSTTEMRERLRTFMQAKGPQSQQDLLDRSGLDVSQPTMSRLIRGDGFTSRSLASKLYYAKQLAPPPNFEAMIKYCLWSMVGFTSLRPNLEAAKQLRNVMARLLDHLEVLIQQYEEVNPDA